MTDVDVLIVGAGLSGIGAAWHLQRYCPNRTFAIVEARDAIGGTWDLFRYPGIRSDSDMYTLGYRFRPWTEAKAIADGPSILKYVRATAAEAGIDRHIRFGRKVTRADWSTADAHWTVEAGGETYRCRFLFMCSGYYDYAQGYLPEFPGRERFRGTVVHPQFWPEDLDYAGKRVVVIGSGATAVTVVPEMAKTAAKVTMLQRSPTYVVSRPAEDGIANALRRWLPDKLAYFLTRWKNVSLGMFFYWLTRKRPKPVAERLIGMVRDELPGFDVETHFTPRYNPWDQRVCLVPDADLFASIREGRAGVVTDTIQTFDETGIALASGAHLDADIIVTATGLKMQLLSGVTLTVDGAPVDMSTRLTYKGMMYSGVPNMASCFGYTNASWTLKADLTSEYVCRLLNHMAAADYQIATPDPDPEVAEEPWLDFTSGYVQRALAELPRQGAERPWKLYQNYALDLVTLRYGRIDDGTMKFANPPGSSWREAAE